MTSTQHVAIICSIMAVFFAEVACECSTANVCVPGPVNAARLVKHTVKATSTCGNPPAYYCHFEPLNGPCHLCNGSDHSVDKMTDGNVKTSWQSVTWWEWYKDNNYTNKPFVVDVTLSFNKSYAVTGEIRITFNSPRPFKMILEKSANKGSTWTPLQYYADDCEEKFNLSNTAVESITQGNFGLHCVQDYSSATPQEGGQVVFDFLRRYEKADFWNGTLQEYFTITDLRLRLLYPGTDGLEKVDNVVENIFNNYFYSIADIRVNARCQCHGHAEYCDFPYTNGSLCDCIHNTAGDDCDKCKPLYNNKAWRPAYSNSEPNPCEKCLCYDHADSCHYNKTLDHGICDDCYHNTTGIFCERCHEKFYRNMSKPLNDPEVCLSCDCFMFGIINNGTCNQTTGQCECKQNVTGRQCNHCADTFWGFELAPVGDCRECSCNGNGTVDGSLSCNQTFGQCPCKSNVHQRTCSECKRGFYSFPKTMESDCLQCDCDYGGSVQEICEKVNGTCLCRSHVEGEQCTAVRTGFYVASFDHLKYEAEDGMGNYEATSNFTGVDQDFTGRGYAKIGLNQFITFTVNLSTSFRDFYIVIRYTSTEKANISLLLSISSCNESNCYNANNFSISHLPHGVGLAWRSQETVLFLRGKVYHLNLTFVSGMYHNTSIEIDSLILLPNVRDVRIYEIASRDGSVHGKTLQQIEDCWNKSTTVAMSQSGFDPPVCQNVTFSTMVEVFDGAIACSCNSTGTMNGTTCRQQGGQCYCKPGVTGHSCDRCKPGYFNFTDSGCTACGCSDLGSSDLVCNPVSGQCLCRPGVVTRTCSRCNATYYGFESGQGCIECKCNASGSSDLQCDKNGVCPCKNSTHGLKCDMCHEHFFNFTSEGCQPCNCYEGGSSSLQCHPNTGICACKANAEGEKCERCKNGTYNSDPQNPDGCTPCFCFDRSNVCSSAAGFVTDYVMANFNFSSTESKINTPKTVQLQSTGYDIEICFRSNSTVSFHLKDNFQGNQLSSYSQLFMMTINYTDAESLNASWTITLKNSQEQEAHFDIKPRPSVLNKEYHARLHEHYTLNNLSAFDLQSILVDVKSVEIKGHFMANGSVTISAKMVTATKGDGEEVGYVENCTCPNNYTELSCGYCNSGFTRKTPNLSHQSKVFSSCVLCSCTSRSNECFPENGTCYNCRMGSKGEHCERCEPNVDNTTDCRRCVPGYFGLTPSSDGCRDCDCVDPNTLYGNNTVCNETTGQCTCKPRIGGRRCDRCHENAYNTSRGCVDCPECYRLIYEDVKKLRVSLRSLDDTIQRLRNGNIGDASFAQRLADSENEVSSLMDDAKLSREIESNVTNQIKQLNESLNHLEQVLMYEVTPGVSTLSDNLTAMERNKNRTEELIQLIRAAIRNSGNILSMSVDGAVRKAEVITNDLSKLVPKFTALANNFTEAAAGQNKTAYEIQHKVDNASSRAEKAQIVAENTIKEQEDLDVSLQTLRMHGDVIQALGEHVNSTAYHLFVNASSVLSGANKTLSELMLLDPDNRDVVIQIEEAAMNESREAQELISSAQNLSQMYSNLSRQVELAVEEVILLTYRVYGTESAGKAILDEAHRAKQEATNALQLASKTLQDAEQMLQILQNFEEKTKEAQNFAELSLMRAKEANITSLNAIQFAQGINASLQATLAVVTKGLNFAQQAWNISTHENQAVTTMNTDANELSQAAAQSKYTTGYYSRVDHNITSINSSSHGHIDSCKGNYSKLTSDALRSAYLAKKAADQANAAAKNVKVKVDHVVREAAKLQKVNVTGLGELKSEIQRVRSAFTQKNLADIITELKEAEKEQQTFVLDYQKEITERKKKIAELKHLYASLSSVTCNKS